MRQKLGSVVKQVSDAFKTLYAFGESKHAAKRDGTAGDKIFSVKTAKEYVDIACRFAKWAKEEFGVKDIRKLTPEMGKAWVNSLAAAGKSPYTIKQAVSALRKLGTAIQKRHGVSVGKLVPENWVGPRRCEELKSEIRGPYEPDEVKKLISYLEQRSPEAALAVKVMCHTGFRASTVLGDRQGQKGLRVAGVREKEGVIVGVGKGGNLAQAGKNELAPVAIKVPKELFAELRPYLAGKHSKDKVFSVRADTVRRKVREACKRLGVPYKGLHGLRYTFANERYSEYRKMGLDDAQARLALSRDMSHRRARVTWIYIKGVGWVLRVLYDDGEGEIA